MAIESVSGGAVAPAAASTQDEMTALSPGGATQTISLPSHGIVRGTAAARVTGGVARRTRLSVDGTECATIVWDETFQKAQMRRERKCESTTWIEARRRETLNKHKL